MTGSALILAMGSTLAVVVFVVGLLGIFAWLMRWGDDEVSNADYLWYGCCLMAIGVVLATISSLVAGAVA